MEKSIGRILFYHPESDSYIEDVVPVFSNSVDESKWWQQWQQMDQVTDSPIHESRFKDHTYIRKLEKEVDELKYTNADYNGRVLMNEELQFKLPVEFRHKFPMYQFFREAGPLQAFAVLQSQMMVNNINLKIWGVFLFEDEANLAVEWLKNNRAEGGFTYEVKPTRITRFQGC